MNQLKQVLMCEDGTKKMMNECLDVVKNSNRVLIFGAGVGGAALFKILKNNNLENKVLAFADNNPLKIGKNYCDNNLIIVAPEEIKKYGEDCSVIIASSAYDKIKDQLIGYGLMEKNIYLFNFAFMDFEYTDGSFIQDHLDDFNRAYQKMADEKSKRIFVNILNYRITKEQKVLEELSKDVDDENYQYFDKELFSFETNEVFLDVGAYIGDTYKAFSEFYDCWDEYIGFEADEKVYMELKDTISNFGEKGKRSLYNLAAWDKKEKLHFSMNPGSSAISPNDKGTFEVQAERVDDVIGKAVSFVKMDIEGAEYNALCGMRNLIQKNRPVIAVCVYHRRDDFYRLTDLIEEMVPNEYTYFFRQYRYTPTETVCYAVPKRRLANAVSNS